MKDLPLELVKYIEVDNEMWILPSSVCKLKEESNVNYSNWSNQGMVDLLPGKELRLVKGSDLWLEIVQLFKNKYKVCITTSQDVRLINLERAIAYYNTSKPQELKHKSLGMNNTSLQLPVQEEPTITSIEFAEQIGLRLKVVHETIRKYKGHLESFSPLPFETAKVEKTPEGIWIPKEVPDHYKLTEDQCYFLATLSRNTPQVVEFKAWLVSTFSALRKERTLNGPMNDLLSYLPGNWEGLVQSMLCHLSSYTDTPYKQEVTLGNGARVDILMSDSEALEIKNHLINPCHIRTMVLEKGYWFQLKQMLPEFKTLYVTSTVGITDEALTLSQLLGPNIQYVSLNSLFTKLSPNKQVPLQLLACS